MLAIQSANHPDAAIKALPLASDHGGISGLCGLSNFRERTGNDLLLGTRYGGSSVLDATKTRRLLWNDRDHRGSVHSLEQLFHGQRRV